jgi:hypothetical protein
VIFESNRIVQLVGPDLCIGVIGGTGAEVKPSFGPFFQSADAVVIAADRDFGSLRLPISAKIFRLAQFDCISSEMIEWLRARLSQ